MFNDYGTIEQGVHNSLFSAGPSLCYPLVMTR